MTNFEKIVINYIRYQVLSDYRYNDDTIEQAHNLKVEILKDTKSILDKEVKKIYDRRKTFF